MNLRTGHRNVASVLMPILAASILASTPLLNGCMLRALKKDIARLESLGLVGGHVSRAVDDEAPIIVVLTTSAPPTVLDSFVLARPGSYFFVVPEGTYRIAAFVDRNGDFAYQPEQEPAASYGAPADIRVAAGQKVGGMDVHIESEPGARLDFPISALDLGRRGTRELPPVRLGEIVTLDDPRFSPENGHLGLWQPVEFLFNVGAGFYFLEPYDAKKMPVLFVHGAGGYPNEFRYLIEHLDRTKFQPWLLYYPSGLDLDVIALAATRWIGTLAVRDEFERIAVVAHSLGGLVSRAAINQVAADTGGGKLAAFVSISSPWNGYAAAAQGVEHSPVIMPMWKDMAPGSPFLTGLFRPPLPPQCPYYLLFSYAGHSLLLSEANDGVVPLSSELAPAAQQAATRVYGFNETHNSILNSAEVSQTLNAILAATVR